MENDDNQDTLCIAIDRTWHWGGLKSLNWVEKAKVSIYEKCWMLSHGIDKHCSCKKRLDRHRENDYEEN